jgi:group I intron endonuclease
VSRIHLIAGNSADADNQQPSSKSRFVVYKITNRANGKSYIGLSCRGLDERWNEHLSRYRSGRRNSRFYAALSKYGPEAFTREVVGFASSEDGARALEKSMIAKFDAHENGYNSNLGGHGLLIVSEEIRRKIGKAQLGKIIPASVRQKMSDAKRGDTKCALHFGSHTVKGAGNPRAGRYLVQMPDGSTQEVAGLRAFCREVGLDYPKFTSKGRSKGFVILKRFNDYPEREYTQAGGNGGGPDSSRD